MLHRQPPVPKVPDDMPPLSLLRSPSPTLAQIRRLLSRRPRLASALVPALSSMLVLALTSAQALASAPTCDTTRVAGKCDFNSPRMIYPGTLSSTTPEGEVAGTAVFTTLYACQTGSNGRVYILLDTADSYDAATGDAKSAAPGFFFDHPDNTVGGHPHQTVVGSLRTSNHRSGCVSGSLSKEIPIVRHGHTVPGVYRQFTYARDAHLASSSGASGNYHTTFMGVGVDSVVVTTPTCTLVTHDIHLPDIDQDDLPRVGSKAGTTVSELSFSACHGAEWAEVAIRSLSTSVIDAKHGILANANTSSSGAKGIGMALEMDPFSFNAFAPVDLTAPQWVRLSGQAPACHCGSATTATANKCRAVA